MPIADYLRATGVRVHGGEVGEVYKNVGKITFARAPIKGADENLFACLKIAADQLKLWIGCSSIDTGTHTKGSRHYTGRAADISEVTPMTDSSPNAAFLTNSDAVRLVTYLLEEGFHVGEGKPWAAVLFGPPRSRWNSSIVDHRDHVHVSIGPRKKAA